MRYYRGCFFAAGLRKEKPELETPLEAEVRTIQVKGLVHHLRNDHSLCWPEVCWHKDNPELILQEPTLTNASDTDCKTFEEMLGTIFRIPHGQGIVTTSRTSYNESFNREKLVFLDKKLDYWKTYSARHACAVISHNCGLVTMLTLVRSNCAVEGFSREDQNNLKKIEVLKKAKQGYNQQAIINRNLARHAKFEEDQRELLGFDFDSVSENSINGT
jgi:hypothetical protein